MEKKNTINEKDFDQLVVHTLRIDLSDGSTLIYILSPSEKQSLIDQFRSFSYDPSEKESSRPRFISFNILEERIVFINTAFILRTIFCFDSPATLSHIGYTDNFKVLDKETSRENQELYLPEAIVKLSKKVDYPYNSDILTFSSLNEGDLAGLELEISDPYMDLREFIELIDDDGENNFIPIKEIVCIEVDHNIIINDEFDNEEEVPKNLKRNSNISFAGKLANMPIKLNSNFLTSIDIKRFKSIKHVSIRPKRVNLLLGKPNSGKSNLLEALSLLGEPYSGQGGLFLSSFIRFEKYGQLFYNQNQNEAIEVKTNIGNAWLGFSREDDSYDFLIGADSKIMKELSLKKASRRNERELFEVAINNNRKSSILPAFYENFRNNMNYASGRGNLFSPVKRYVFQAPKNYSNTFSQFLTNSGDNLYTILENNSSLRDIAGNFFEEYGFEFILVTGENRFVIQKKVGKVGFQLPLSMTPDTFQRMLYHLAAIESNENAVLLFEEPEAHSFPPYIAMIAELIGKKPDNQYFISTHSPYVFQSIVSNTPKKDLAIWIMAYKNNETQIKQLTEKQIQELLTKGIDIFQNIERYSNK